MSNKYNLVAYKGKMVPSGYTEGTLSFEATIAHLKNISMYDSMDLVIGEYVDSVLKSVKVDGQSIVSVTNLKTNKTWGTGEFSKQLFAAVNRNPKDYRVEYSSGTTQEAKYKFGRYQVKDNHIEEATKDSQHTVRLLGSSDHAKRSYLIEVSSKNPDGSTSVDYFDLEGGRRVDKPNVKDGETIADKYNKDLTGPIPSQEFAAKYDEILAGAMSENNKANSDGESSSIEGILKDGKDIFYKDGVLSYSSNPNNGDEVQGEISKLLMYASSRNMKNLVDKTLEFVRDASENSNAEIKITEEDLDGVISVESLNNLMESMRGASAKDFSQFIQLTSPHGYSMIQEVASIFSYSGLSELVNSVIRGELDNVSGKSNISDVERVKRAFSSYKNSDIADITMMSIIAASPDTQKILDSLFNIARLAPSQPKFPATKASIQSLGIIQNAFSNQQQSDIVFAATGIRPELASAVSAFSDTFNSSKVTKFSDETVKRVGAMIDSFMTDGVAKSIAKEARAVKMSEKRSASEKGRAPVKKVIDSADRHIKFASNFSSFSIGSKKELAAAQGNARALMALMLSLNKTSLSDDFTAEAYENYHLKKDFLKNIASDYEHSDLGTQFKSMTGLKLEKNGEEYHVFDGDTRYKIDASNFENQMNVILKRNNGIQSSGAAWRAILAPHLGSNKVRFGNADTRASSLKYTGMAAPYIRAIADSIKVDESTKTLKFADGFSQESYAEALGKKFSDISGESGLSEMLKYDSAFSQPLVSDYLELQKSVVADKMQNLIPVTRKKNKNHNINGAYACGKHIGELLEVSMLSAFNLGIMENELGDLSNIEPGSIQVLHSPSDGDINLNQLPDLIRTHIDPNASFADIPDVSAIGSITLHNGKLFVAMKENRDTGAVDGEVMVFSKNAEGKCHMDKHPVEFKNSNAKLQHPHLNQYSPHAAVEGSIGSGAGTVAVHNTVAINVITPKDTASPTAAHTHHVAFDYQPRDPSSGEGVRKGHLI